MSVKSWFDKLAIWIKIVLIICLIIFFPLGVIFLITYLVSGGTNSKKTESPVENFEHYINEKEDLKDTRKKLILHGDEKLLYTQSSDFYEERAVRNSVRTGHSIRIMKGWWYHLGSGQAESHGELREIDSGILYITTKRFIFNGTFKSYNYSYAKLLSVEPFNDSVRIAVDGRQKTLTFTTDTPILLGVSLQNLAGETKLEKDAEEFLQNELKKIVVSKATFFGGEICINMNSYKEMCAAFKLYAKSIDIDVNEYTHFIKKVPIQITNTRSKIIKFANLLEDFDKELNKVKKRLGESAKKEAIEQELDRITDKKYGKAIIGDSLMEILNSLNDLSPGILGIGKLKKK